MQFREFKKKMPMFIFQVIWLKKKKIEVRVYVYCPHIIIFRVTFSVGHERVQMFALFGLFCLEKSISWLVLYQTTVIVGLTHASK